MQLRSLSHVSPRMWAWVRYGMVIAMLIEIILLIVTPTNGLFLWWRLTVPLLPFVFLVAPGIWRNVCPLAASNQTPRLLKITKALTPPKWFQQYGFVIGVASFFLMASSRKWLFNTNGPATGLLLFAALGSAFLGGYLFKGKSGWCSSICPLYHVQRLYNRTPFVTVGNAHCDPCVGCTKNCYDFNPKSAYLADVHDDDRRYASYRKFFAAAMPGFVVGYFTISDPTNLLSVITMYLQFALAIAASVGLFSVLDTFLEGATGKITAVYGAAAFNLFYWFGLGSWLNAAGMLVGWTPPTELARVLQAGILIMSFVWVSRSFRLEPNFLAQFKQSQETSAVLDSGQRAQITFVPTNVSVPAKVGSALLEVAKVYDQPIDSGCLAGQCGCDPILVLDGMENLSPMTSSEKETLARLGLGPNCRLACVTRVNGPVQVLLSPKEPNGAEPQNARVMAFNRTPVDAPSITIEAPTKPAVTFLPSQVSVPVAAGCTLLELAEKNKQPIAASCRMGVCGSDPVRIVEGMESLSPASADEKSTLSRLGLGENCRLACVSRVKGAVTVSTQLKEPDPIIESASTMVRVQQRPQINWTNPSPERLKSTAEPSVIFMPEEKSVPVTVGRTLLEIAENSNQPIEAGCRMGVCGEDPILVMEGMENLNPVGKDEKNTLERLGLGANCRLACMCRVKGPVKVSLQTKGATVKASVPTQVSDYDRNLKSVVIIGNGAAGVTAADYVRRHHPECEIHVVSKEKHHFYNRIGIMRLIYGRSAMSGLYLQPEAWYDERNITCWLNTHATRINRGHKKVLLATGEEIPYDRLILASGSSSYVPQIPGFGLQGTYALRDAEHAMEIRAYVQKHRCHATVVAGGGLLGLEAAYALHQMGLTVWVLERGDWLLRRQLDERGGKILKHCLEEMGLVIETRAETQSVEGEGRVSQVRLCSGQILPCDVFLVAAGIQPNVDLALTAGLKINKGIVVDETMQTSAPSIYAAGDVCEYDQKVPGLWPVAIEQAKVAAINALGGKASYKHVVPVAMLKVVGVDVTSVGRFEAKSKSENEITFVDEDGRGYRKLVIEKGKIVGAILIGHPAESATITTIIKEGIDVSDCMKSLKAGQWQVLEDKVG